MRVPVRHGGLSSLDAGRRSVNRVAEEIAGSIATPKSAEGQKRENDGFVRTGEDAVRHNVARTAGLLRIQRRASWHWHSQPGLVNRSLISNFRVLREGSGSSIENS